MFAMTRIAQAAGLSTAPSNFMDIILRTGTGAAVTTTTTSLLNLSGNGGLILTKNYTGTNDWSIVDTVRGLSRDLVPTTTAAATTQAAGVTAVSSTGYTTGTLAKRNGSGLALVDYVMRQGPGFLQIIQRTETGSASNVAHNLGVRPGFILAKSVTLAQGWCVWHRFFDLYGAQAGSSGLSTNSTAAARYVSYIDATSTFFNNEIYAWDGATEHIAYKGGTVVYYVFGHDPSPSGRIQCGGYAGNGSATGPTVTLGWSPRLLLIKNRTGTGDWLVVDTSRGFTSGNEAAFALNRAAAQTSVQLIDPTPAGFQIKSTVANVNTAGDIYIYVAFR